MLHPQKLLDARNQVVPANNILLGNTYAANHRQFAYFRHFLLIQTKRTDDTMKIKFCFQKTESNWVPIAINQLKMHLFLILHFWYFSFLLFPKERLIIHISNLLFKIYKNVWIKIHYLPGEPQNISKMNLENDNWKWNIKIMMIFFI